MGESAIRLSGIRKSFPSGDGQLEVLKGVDLDVEAGDFVSIMGPSGSGKSTLLHLVGLLDTPTAGEVALRGEAAQDWTSGERAMARRRHLGFVFQGFNLMPRMTALQNVMLPMAIAGVPRTQRRDRARRLLADVGLSDRASHRPAKLSGGQKQRVAIARALALDPPILLCDEPTGNLDSKTSQDIMGLFQALNRRGRTVVQVTHDEGMARFGNRIIRFQDGAIERQDLVQAPRRPHEDFVDFQGQAADDGRWRKDWVGSRAHPVRVGLAAPSPASPRLPPAHAGAMSPAPGPAVETFAAQTPAEPGVTASRPGPATLGPPGKGRPLRYVLDHLPQEARK